MLGGGEPLHSVEESVKVLLSRTHREYSGLPVFYVTSTHMFIAFTFFDKEREDISPCASLLVTVQEWHCNNRTRGSSDTVSRTSSPCLSKATKESLSADL